MSENVGEKDQFILYVSGIAPNSLRALQAAREICAEVNGEAVLEIVDVYRQPEEANKILATPTLVRVRNGETKKVVGNIIDKKRAIKLLHSS
jgi:hypothetical protein